MKLYTIGHSTTELPTFLDALLERRIEVLADIRSKPRSRAQQFDFAPLEAAVEEAGVRYRYLGDKLGGIPRDYDLVQRWRPGRLDPVIISHLRGLDVWHEGIAELGQLVRRSDGVCVMCSEANVNECHRKAIALDLAEAVEGLSIVHLMIRGQVVSDIGIQDVIP